MTRERILVAHPAPGVRGRLRAALEEAGFEAHEAGSAVEALAALAGLAPDAVLADAGLAPAGETLLEGARGSDAVLVATGPGEAGAALAALRAGAESYLVEPLDARRVAAALERALEKRRLRSESRRLRERVRERVRMLGTSPEMSLVNEVIGRAAPTKTAVLLLGEAGTGKTLAAQALHEASPRRHGPFVRMTCAALSEPLVESDLFGDEEGPLGRCTSKLEQADGGTLLLHEVSSLAPAAQVRLLRLLQGGKLERARGGGTIGLDVRVVAATSCDLAGEVRAGRFREDLYHRLRVVTAQLPPLRRRKGDIPVLVGHFAGLAAGARGGEFRGLTPGALSALFAHDWPGNVRELQSVVEEAVRRCEGPLIGAGDLPPALRGARLGEPGGGLAPGATLLEIEREAILRTLARVGGSTARAAGVLGISVRKIQYRLKEYRAGEAAARPAAPEGGPAARGP